MKQVKPTKGQNEAIRNRHAGGGLMVYSYGNGRTVCYRDFNMGRDGNLYVSAGGHPVIIRLLEKDERGQLQEVEYTIKLERVV